MAKDIDPRSKEKEMPIKIPDHPLSFPTRECLLQKHVSYWMPSEAKM